MEHIWLEATRLGLAFQPLAVAPYLFARLERGSGEGFEEEEAETLMQLRQWQDHLFGSHRGCAEVLLFRLAHAPPPRKRALRRRVESIFSVERP